MIDGGHVQRFKDWKAYWYIIYFTSGETIMNTGPKLLHVEQCF